MAAQTGSNQRNEKLHRQDEMRQQRARRQRNSILSWAAVTLLLVLIVVAGFGAYLSSRGTQIISGTSTEETSTEETSTEVTSTQETQQETQGEHSLSPEGSGEDLTIELDTSKKSLRIVMVGDMLMHTRVIQSGQREDGTYNYDEIFAHTSSAFHRADIAIVNEEAIIGGEELGLSGYPNFNVGYEVGDALANAGFNVICHATNHVYDRLEQGIINSLDFWETNYPKINVVGIHHAEDPDPLCLLEYDNFSIGILNYTDIMNYSMSLKETTVDRLTDANVESVKEDLTRARELADFVIVIPHWGEEYQTTVSYDQKKWSQIFLESGVDLVIGAHPHVIEPVEWLEDDEGHRMLCYYSIGNFVEFSNLEYAGMYKYAIGAMADVTLSIEDGEVSIAEYGVEPTIVQMGTGFGETTVYFLKDYTQELLETNYMHQVDSLFTIENCKNFCKEIFGDLYTE